MNELISLSEGFKLKHELFVIGCDSAEAQEKWDVEEKGEMETYFLGEIMSIVLYLASADGKITEEETAYINNLLGFKDSTKTYMNIYESCKAEIDDVAKRKIPESINLLKTINEEMAEHYREMLLLGCKIVAASDRFVTTEEDEFIKLVTSLVK